MNKSLLYVGNQLSKHGYNKTSIETLGVFLEGEGYDLILTSDKKNQIIRLFDMLFTTFLKAKKVNYVLIDVYSTSSFWYAFLCSQLVRFFTVRYIPILRGGDLPNRLRKNPKLSRMIFANAYINVAPSGYLQHIFEKEGFSNVIHIPNSIEIDQYEYKRRTEFAPKLLWVRAFASIYNPTMAVSVLKQLQEFYPAATLTMVGPDKDGSLISTKTFAEELGVTVVFTGQLAKEDWWRLAAEHDVFINTTHFDNTPISVMEAMALGLPVVTTNVGGIPYLLSNTENALLVNDGAADEMTTAILNLISDKERTLLMTQNARSLVMQMDWKIVKEQWEKLLV